MAFASLEQIASILNLTPQMVNRHVKLHGMPRVSRGEYDLIKCVHWYIAYKDRLIQEARRGKETEGQARQRLVIAEANLKELQFAKARGNVIEIDIAKELWAKLVLVFKSRILLLPSKLPTLVLSCTNPNEVRELLEIELMEALHELSQTKLDTNDIPRPGGTHGGSHRIRKSSPKAHRKRLGRRTQDPERGELRRAGQVEDKPGGISKGDDERDNRPKGGDGHLDDSSEDRKDGDHQ